MGLRIEKSFQVNEPLEKVWSFLSDPAKVASCVPGAQITEKVDEKTYRGAISMKVGPSVTDYKGEVQIVRLYEHDGDVTPLAERQRQSVGVITDAADEAGARTNDDGPRDEVR